MTNKVRPEVLMSLNCWSHYKEWHFENLRSLRHQIKTDFKYDVDFVQLLSQQAANWV